MADEEQQELSPKELKKKEKEEKKAAKKAGKGFDGVATDEGAFYADIDDEDEGFSPSVLFIVILIILIWIMAILLIWLKAVL